MNTEFETQILDVDREEVAKKLREIGAVEEAEVMQRRWVFDMDQCNDVTGEWVRLRQAGDQRPTITYKKRIGKGVSETEEIEIEADDFEKAEQILSKLPFTGKYYQENKRHKFIKDDIEYTLDTWPGIPTYLEVEAKSEKKVDEGIELLGLTQKPSGHIGTSSIYKKYGINLHSMKEVKFENAS